tara:strand:- start:3554 stop:6655 length:3102 start_codon:yes stop_codon:yes gene_type:complete
MIPPSFIYDNLTINKSLIVKQNVNINKLNTKKLIIENDAVLTANVLSTNRLLKINNSLQVKNNLNIINNLLIIKKNTNIIHNLNNTLSKNSSMTINNSINIMGNMNINNLRVKSHIECNNSVSINNLTNIYENLNNKFLINSYNLLHTENFQLYNDINCKNITIYGNNYMKSMDVKENLSLSTMLFIKDSLRIANGIIKLPTFTNINSNGSIMFNQSTNNVESIVNNKLQSLSGCSNKKYISNINVDKTHNISFKFTNKDIINFYNSNININYNTNVLGTLEINKNLNINNNLNITGNTTTIGNLKIQGNTIQLPYDHSPISIQGGIRYNQSYSILQVVTKDKWTYLNYLNDDYSGIAYNDTNINIKLYNNSIISFTNNTSINNTTYINSNLNISKNAFIQNNLYTTDKLYIDHLPIKIFNNLLRTPYNNKNHSITTENYNAHYKTPFMSHNFYCKNITTYFKSTNVYNYILDTYCLLNQYDSYPYQYITQNIYITHIVLYSIQSNINNYTNIYYTINLLNNTTIIKTLQITNTNKIIKLEKPILLEKHTLFNIQIKANNNINNNILINLSGYYNTPIILDGDSNFITDNIISFNTNTSFYTNLNINSNVNVYDTTNINNLYNPLQINKLNILNNSLSSNNSNKLEILDTNNCFVINNKGSIGIGTSNPTSLICIKNPSKKYKSFTTTGGMAFQSNLNNINQVFTKNIYTYSNLNTNNTIINYLTNINNNININNCIVDDTTNLSNDLNIKKYIYTDILNIPKYDTNIHNTLLNDTLLNDTLYISYSDNKNILIKKNQSGNYKNYIYHHKIKKNKKQLCINNFTNIEKDSISMAIVNNQNIFQVGPNLSTDYHIQPHLLINKHGTIYTNNKLVLNNYNISDKLQTILYDVHGPQNPIVLYDFNTNNATIPITIKSTGETTNNFIQQIYNFNISNITPIVTNTIIYNTIESDNLPFYTIKGLHIPLQIIYFKNISLINNNIKSFINNISSYELYNPYNLQVSLFYSNDGKIIYPKTNIYYQTTFINYGLKSLIK